MEQPLLIHAMKRKVGETCLVQCFESARASIERTIVTSFAKRLGYCEMGKYVARERPRGEEDARHLRVSLQSLAKPHGAQDDNRDTINR